MLGRSYGGYSIEMSLDKVEYSRSIYSLLDFLGDVGGLSSILLEIGLSLGFLFSPALDEFLASNIFPLRRKGAQPLFPSKYFLGTDAINMISTNKTKNA